MKRGGRRRPVSTVFGVRALLLATLALVSPAGATVAVAHGGVPVVQLGADRVRPGDSIEVLADMSSQGTYALLLVAPAAARSWTLGGFDADYEGHVRTVITIPADIAPGTYRLVARGDSEEAMAPLEVVTGAEQEGVGQPLGQDEARAPVPSDPGVAAPVSVGTSPEDPRDADSGLIPAAVALALAVVGALGVGLLARSRRARVGAP